MYKLKNGKVLPKEFKIKVTPDESKALQEYLFSVGKTWNGGADYVKNLEKKMIFFNKNITFVTSESYFKEDCLQEIHFQYYFEKSFPEKWCIQVTEDNYKELDVWMHRNWKNYPKYKDGWKVLLDKFCNIFHSGEILGFCHTADEVKKGFTPITTEQFRNQFGDFRPKDVEIVFDGKMCSDEVYEKAIDKFIQENNKMDALTLHNQKLSKENSILKSQIEQLKSSGRDYYKEKSERLIKEKFEDKNYIETLKDQVAILTNQIQEKEDDIQSKSSICIKQAKEIIDLKEKVELNRNTVSKQSNTIARLKEELIDYDNIKLVFSKLLNLPTDGMD